MPRHMAEWKHFFIFNGSFNNAEEDSPNKTRSVAQCRIAPRAGRSSGLCIHSAYPRIFPVFLSRPSAMWHHMRIRVLTCGATFSSSSSFTIVLFMTYSLRRRWQLMALKRGDDDDDDDDDECTPTMYNRAGYQQHKAPPAIAAPQEIPWLCDKRGWCLWWGHNLFYFFRDVLWDEESLNWEVTSKKEQLF